MFSVEGDPAMIMIPSTQIFRTGYVFALPASQSAYLSIIVQEEYRLGDYTYILPIEQHRIEPSYNVMFLCRHSAEQPQHLGRSRVATGARYERLRGRLHSNARQLFRHDSNSAAFVWYGSLWSVRLRSGSDVRIRVSSRLLRRRHSRKMSSMYTCTCTCS